MKEPLNIPSAEYLLGETITLVRKRRKEMLDFWEANEITDQYLDEIVEMDSLIIRAASLLLQLPKRPLPSISLAPEPPKGLGSKAKRPGQEHAFHRISDLETEIDGLNEYIRYLENQAGLPESSPDLGPQARYLKGGEPCSLSS